MPLSTLQRRRCWGAAAWTAPSTAPQGRSCWRHADSCQSCSHPARAARPGMQSSRRALCPCRSRKHASCMHADVCSALSRESTDTVTAACRGFNLPAAYVIHTVGPIYSRHPPEQAAQLLADCHRCALVAFTFLAGCVVGTWQGSDRSCCMMQELVTHSKRPWIQEGSVPCNLLRGVWLSIS